MAQAYRYPQQAAQRPQGQPRRGPAPPGPIPDPGYWAAQQQANISQDAARRRATKPTDLDLPEGCVEFVPELAGMYNSLRAHEKRLDAKMNRLMMEYQDRVVANVKQRRRLRLFMWTEVENQPWQLEHQENDFDFSNSEATYKVYIVGKLLPHPSEKPNAPEAEEEKTTETESATTGEKPKENPYAKIKPQEKLASSFFKSITVEYGRGKDFPEQYASFSWNKPTNLAPESNFRQWSFKRNGDDNLNVTLHFQRDENPERFRLSKAMEWVVDEPEATRSEIITRISDYVKYLKLQEDDDKRTIRCDKRLKDIFNRDTLYFSEIPQLIAQSEHLTPAPPLSLPFTIRVDKDYHDWPQQEKYTIYDVNVWIDDPVRDHVLAVTSSKLWNDQLRQIVDTDEQLALTMQKAKISAARANFFKSMSEDPIGVMKRWLSSQDRDLQILMGEVFAPNSDGTLPDVLRRGGEDSIWSTEKVREAVNYMLSKPEAMEVVRNQGR